MYMKKVNGSLVTFKFFFYLVHNTCIRGRGWGEPQSNYKGLSAEDVEACLSVNLELMHIKKNMGASKNSLGSAGVCIYLGLYKERLGQSTVTTMFLSLPLDFPIAFVCSSWTRTTDGETNSVFGCLYNYKIHGNIWDAKRVPWEPSIISISHMPGSRHAWEVAPTN